MAKPEGSQAPAGWWRRLGWMVLIWTASVSTLAALALVFRLLMDLAGLRS